MRRLFEQIAILWTQACKIEGVSPKLTSFVFSDGNVAAKRLAKVTQKYQQAKQAYLMKIKKARKPIMEGYGTMKDIEKGDFHEDKGTPPLPRQPSETGKPAKADEPEQQVTQRRFINLGELEYIPDGKE